MSATLAGTLPALQQAYQRLQQYGATQGITFGIADYGGLRSQADTTRILGYRQQDYAAAVRVNPDTAKVPIDTWRPIAPYGLSYHNFGAAFDVALTAWPAEWTEAQALTVLGSYAPQIGLRWGGRFPADRVDPAHFELALSLEDAQAEYGAFVGGQASHLPDIGTGTQLAELLGPPTNALPTLPAVPDVSVISTVPGGGQVPLIPTTDANVLTRVLQDLVDALNTPLGGVPVWGWAVGAGAAAWVLTRER